MVTVEFASHVCDGHVNMVSFVVGGGLCHMFHGIIYVVDCACLAVPCDLPLLIHVEHLNLCCDVYVAAHFAGYESRTLLEVASVD